MSCGSVGREKTKMGERTAKMLAKKLQQVGSGMVNRHYESNVEKRLRIPTQL